MRRLIRICVVCQDKHTLGNGRYKNVYDETLIHLALKGAYIDITNSVKIGFREINISSTHTFCTDNIKNPSEL